MTDNALRAVEDLAREMKKERDDLRDDMQIAVKLIDHLLIPGAHHYDLRPIAKELIEKYNFEITGGT